MPETRISPHDTTKPQIAKYPNWTVLPVANIKSITADHRIDTDIDVNGVGRIRVKPGYNANVDDVRYTT